jgi:hypothetical protein
MRNLEIACIASTAETGYIGIIIVNCPAAVNFDGSTSLGSNALQN